MTTSVPIDKDWAWVVLGVCFSNLLICSIGQSAGVFNMFFIQEYQEESKAMVALCGVLIPSLTTCAGPIASIIVEFFGPRKCLLLGAVLTFLGFTLTFMAESFTHIFITFGLMSGIGLGITYSTSLYVLGFYFDRYRNIAFGIALSAIGIGMMAFPPFLDLVYEQYSVKGAILVTGAISSHLFISVLVLLPHLPVKTLNEQNITDLQKETTSDQHLQNISHVGKYVSDQNFSRQTVQDSVTHEHDIRWENNADGIDTLEQKDVKNTAFFTGDVQDENVIPNIAVSEKSNITTNKNKNNMNFHKFNPCDMRSCLEKYVNIEVILFSTYLFIIHIGLSCIRLHFPAYARKQGTGIGFASILITVFGLGNTIARLSVGVITNNRKKLMYIVNFTCTVIACTLCFIGPHMSTNFSGQIIFAFLFSLFGNGFQSISAPIAIDLVGLELFNVVNGALLMFSGVGILIGPILAGFFFDRTQTYFSTFMISGCSYAVAGILGFIILLIRIYRKS